LNWNCVLAAETHFPVEVWVRFFICTFSGKGFGKASVINRLGRNESVRHIVAIWDSLFSVCSLGLPGEGEEEQEKTYEFGFVF